jgi:hypothetical protein
MVNVSKLGKKEKKNYKQVISTEINLSNISRIAKLFGVIFGLYPTAVLEFQIKSVILPILS